MDLDKMTPEQLAQPVNGYQLLYVTKQLEDIAKDLSTVVAQTNGVVTQVQLKEFEKDMKKYIDKAVADAEKSIHQEYRPMKQNLSRFVWTLVTAAVTQVVVTFGLVYVTLIKK